MDILLNKGYCIENGIFFEGNVPSLKNSKEIQTGFRYQRDNKGGFIFTKEGEKVKQKFTRLDYSKSVKDYLKRYEHQFQQYKVDIQRLFKGHTEWLVGIYFIRDSHRKYDYINACQIIADLMVKYTIIPDDNTLYFNPIFLGTEVDSGNPGFYIVCLNNQFILKDYLFFDIKKTKFFNELSFEQKNELLTVITNL
jgi:hypothetical protein